MVSVTQAARAGPEQEVAGEEAVSKTQRINWTLTFRSDVLTESESQLLNKRTEQTVNPLQELGVQEN